jgi:hypothetical protein
LARRARSLGAGAEAPTDCAIREDGERLHRRFPRPISTILRRTDATCRCGILERIDGWPALSRWRASRGGPRGKLARKRAGKISAPLGMGVRQRRHRPGVAHQPRLPSRRPPRLRVTRQGLAGVCRDIAGRRSLTLGRLPDCVDRGTTAQTALLIPRFRFSIRLTRRPSIDAE